MFKNKISKKFKLACIKKQNNQTLSSELTIVRITISRLLVIFKTLRNYLIQKFCRQRDVSFMLRQFRARYRTTQKRARLIQAFPSAYPIYIHTSFSFQVCIRSVNVTTSIPRDIYVLFMRILLRLYKIEYKFRTLFTNDYLDTHSRYQQYKCHFF